MAKFFERTIEAPKAELKYYREKYGDF